MQSLLGTCPTEYQLRAKPLINRAILTYELRVTNAVQGHSGRREDGTVLIVLHVLMTGKVRLEYCDTVS
jgi:hypothetical protein